MKGDYMRFLRWLGGIVLLVWLLGLIFSFGGLLIHWLLVVAAVIFIISWITDKKK
ncbi:MAG: lmo0937 family membrane protein [Bacilli bacterium]|jgi:hypothetical protein